MHSASAGSDSHRHAFPNNHTSPNADFDIMADDRHAHFRPCVDPNANTLSDAASTAQTTNPTFVAYTAQSANANPTKRNTSPSSS